jgi:hypothetical protein
VLLHVAIRCLLIGVWFATTLVWAYESVGIEGIGGNREIARRPHGDDGGVVFVVVDGDIVYCCVDLKYCVEVGNHLKLIQKGDCLKQPKEK